MFSLQAIAAAGVVLLIFIAHRLAPNRKIFLLFSCIILMAAGALFFYRTQPAAPEPLTAEEQADRAAQQQLVADWYVSYQTYIEKLDRNWQRYHRILSDFEADVISIEEAHDRLSELEKSSRALMNNTEQLEPPSELKSTNYDLTASIFLKVRSYAHEQHQAIERTAVASDPKLQETNNQEAQSRHLREVMVRESPTGLFTGAELAALRDHVDMKE